MREQRSINRKWAFAKTDRIPEEFPRDWNLVNLPHTWNGIDGQDGGDDYYRGKGCYVRTLPRTELPKADRYYLEFRGANSSADVYCNGEHLAHHDGGYSTWRVELTAHLKEENLLAVVVDNAPNQRVYPQTADFTFYGGLYRDVWVLCVNQTHFDLDHYGGPGIKVTPRITGQDAQVEVKVLLTDPKPGQAIRYAIVNREGQIVAELTGSETTAMLAIANVRRWHGRKDPYLYRAVAELLEGNRVIDRVSARFGCRSFAIDPDRGFLLNGEEYPLRGVCRHQDRWEIGNALLPEHHREDMELICELGANTIRLAHYQHDQYFYDLCDERGMVVWAEIPYITRHMPEGRENTISQMKELIVQNYNHPSIVVWGLSNETTMLGSSQDLLDNHRILNDLAHQMDPTRKTVIAVVSACPMDHPYLQIPDAVSYNHYFGWYLGDTSMNGPWFDQFHETYPDIPIGCSEYGCEGLNWHNSNPTRGDYSETYQAFYHQELIKQLFSRNYIWATHVWNMFDFGADARMEGGENGQNHKGLVTIDRTYKKDAFYAYKAWLSQEPFVHICGKRYVERTEAVTAVTVYSNLPWVELFANGVSLGKQEAKDHFFQFQVPNQGLTRLVAVAQDQRDESVIKKVEQFNPRYRLHADREVSNWSSEEPQTDRPGAE